jgi:hypothetical protein
MNIPNGLVENIAVCTLCISAWSVPFYGECLSTWFMLSHLKDFDEMSRRRPQFEVLWCFYFGSHMSTISALNGAVPICVCAQEVYMLWDEAHITTFHVLSAAVYLGNGVFVERQLRTKQTVWNLQKTMVE